MAPGPVMRFLLAHKLGRVLQTLAKLCAGLKKPDAQTVLRPGAITPFLRPLEFQKIRFLGGKLGTQIAEDFDAQLVGELWKVPLEELQRKYGAESGLWAWEIIRGIDRSEVTRKQEVKSMISSKNFKPPISTWEEAVSVFLLVVQREAPSDLLCCTAVTLAPNHISRAHFTTERSPRDQSRGLGKSSFVDPWST